MLRSRQLDNPLLGGELWVQKNVMPNDGSKIANRERVASVMGRDKSVCTSGGVVSGDQNDPNSSEIFTVEVQQNTTFGSNSRPALLLKDRNDPMDTHKSRNDLVNGTDYLAMRSQSRNDSSPVHKSRNDFAESRNYLAMRHQNRNDSPHTCTYQSERDGNADSNLSLRTQDHGDYRRHSPYFVNQHECEFDGNRKPW